MKLSICIPTYNRAGFLPAAIESILSQLQEEVEIVISDNASTDDTQEVLRPYLEKYPQIVYSRHPVNQGADRNFLRVVSLARGEYCWFLGSDDILEPGAIGRILQILQDEPTLSGICVNKKPYDAKLEKTIYSEAPTIYRANQRFTDWKNCFLGLFTYFGYLSAQVFKRSLWNQALTLLEPERFLNIYVHVYVIGKMAQLNPNWLYLHEPYVGWRSGNDSFLSEGYFRRFEIDARGLPEIARELCSQDPRIATRIISRFFYTHIRCHVIGAVFHPDRALLIPKMRATSVCLYKSYLAFWTTLIWWFFIPQPLMRMMRTVYREMRKPSTI